LKLQILNYFIVFDELSTASASLILLMLLSISRRLLHKRNGYSQLPKASPVTVATLASARRYMDKSIAFFDFSSS
jgi:hypothetical protein